MARKRSKTPPNSNGFPRLPMVRDDRMEARESIEDRRAADHPYHRPQGVMQDSIIGYTAAVSTAAMPKKLQQILEGKDLLDRRP